MSTKIDTIQLLDGLGGTAITTSSSDDVKASLAEFPEIREVLQEPGEMTLRLASGSPFHLYAAAGGWTETEVLEVTYADSSKSHWVVSDVQVDYAPERDVGATVRLYEYWWLLGSRGIRRTLTPTTRVDTTLAITGLTPSDALDIIFSTSTDYNTPAKFNAGTVPAAFSGVQVSIEANGESHLDLLFKLLEDLAPYNGGEPAEAEFVLSGGEYTCNVVEQVGTDASEVDASGNVTPDASLRPVWGPTGYATTSNANRQQLRERREVSERFNRIIPIGGTETEPLTIGQAWWYISSVDSSTSGQLTLGLTERGLFTQLTLEAVEDLYFGNDTDGWHEVLSFPADNDVTVSTSLTSIEEIWWRFAIDSSGTELVHLDGDGITGETDVREVYARFPDVAYYRNLLDTGGTADVEQTQGQSLLDYRASTDLSLPTTSEVTNPAYVRHGSASTKVEATEANTGVKANTFTVNTSRDGPYLSLDVAVYVESGRVRVSLEDADGTRHPEGDEQAESAAANLLRLQVGGIEPADGDAFVIVEAIGGAATFYVDSIAVTASSTPVQYQRFMGGTDLWRKGANALIRAQTENESSWDGDAIDVSYLQSGSSYAEITVGSWVNVRDYYDTSGASPVWQVDFDARVQALRTFEDPASGRIVKTIRVEQKQATAASRLVSRQPNPELPTAPPASTSSEFVSECGTDVIAIGETVVTVSPASTELAFDQANIQITPRAPWGSATEFWVSRRTPTEFDVSVDADPSSGPFRFDWFAVSCAPLELQNLFVVDVDSVDEIYAFWKADGSNKTRAVTSSSTVAPNIATAPASGKGYFVEYASTASGDEWKLFEFDLDTQDSESEVADITSDLAGASQEVSALSYDAGSNVLVGLRKGSGSGDALLFSIKPDGTGFSSLWTGYYSGQGLTQSPAQNLIYFTNRASLANNPRISSIAHDGTGETEIIEMSTNNEIKALSYDPQQSRLWMVRSGTLAYVLDDGSDYTSFGGSTSNPTSRATGYGCVVDLVGRKVYFAYNSSTGGSDPQDWIDVVDADTSDPGTDLEEYLDNPVTQIGPIALGPASLVTGPA